MQTLSFSSFPQLVTEHLFLRKLSLKDDEQIFSLRSNDIVNKYLDRPKARSIEDAREFIKKINLGIHGHEWVFWGICFRGQVKIVGTICLWNFFEKENKAEIGYELLPEFHGKGIMQEALSKVIEFGFNQLQLQTIEAWTTIRNENSKKILERNYFKRDFEAESNINREIEGPDRIIYTLSQTNYLHSRS